MRENLVSFMSISNVLTGLRLVFGFILFGLLALFNREIGGISAGTAPGFAVAALVLLIVSLSTDFLDGYLARWMKNESELGRMADPLVDKVLICGSLVMVLGLPRDEGSGILQEWMVAVVVSRELLVQGIRSAMEKRGFEFSASSWGKAKMFVQSICVLLLLSSGLKLVRQYWFDVVTGTALWCMVVLTLLSGGIYVYRASKLLNEDGMNRVSA